LPCWHRSLSHWSHQQPRRRSQQQKPNILVIMGDDIGYWNVSAYNRGMMGYRTPNIDRIAAEGAIFTDYYGQQSCTFAACSTESR
jgi:arylsulfatase